MHHLRTALVIAAMLAIVTPALAEDAQYLVAYQCYDDDTGHPMELPEGLYQAFVDAGWVLVERSTMSDLGLIDADLDFDLEISLALSPGRGFVSYDVRTPTDGFYSGYQGGGAGCGSSHSQTHCFSDHFEIYVSGATTFPNAEAFALGDMEQTLLGRYYRALQEIENEWSLPDEAVDELIALCDEHDLARACRNAALLVADEDESDRLQERAIELDDPLFRLQEE